jgi:hypothetical protein
MEDLNVDINTLANEIKATYHLSEDEYLLLELFIRTRGHSLSEYEYLLNAPLHYPQLQNKDIGAIMAALTIKTRSDIIGISGDNEKREYTLIETFKEQLIDIEISYIAVVLFENYGNAKESRQSLNDIFINENNTLYLYLALTPPEGFPKLRDRINAKKKTIFFMSHKSNFSTEQYDICIKKWIDFIRESGKEQVEFYLVKNQKKENEKTIDCYKFLYSSLLAQNTVRFNIYKYNENGKVVTGIGNLIESQMNENSLYDITKRAYTDAWNERIGVRQISIKEWLRRWLINRIQWLFFIIILIIAGVIVYNDINLASNIASIVICFITGFFGKHITSFVFRRKQELPF